MKKFLYFWDQRLTFMTSLINFQKEKKLSSLYRLTFALILPLSIFSPQSITILSIFIGLIFLKEISKNRINYKEIFKSNVKLFYSLGGLSILAFLSSIFSVEFWLSLKGAFHLTLLLLIGFTLFCGAQRTFYRVQIWQGLWIGFIIALILSFIEIKTQGFFLHTFYDLNAPAFKYNKFTSILSLLIPLIILMPCKYLQGSFGTFLKEKENSHSYKAIGLMAKIFLLGFAFYIVLHLQSDTSKLTFLLGIFLFFLIFTLPLNFKKYFMSLLICLCFLTPLTFPKIYNLPSVNHFVFTQIHKESFYDRLSLWTYIQDIVDGKHASQASLSTQLFGFGIDSSKSQVLSVHNRTWINPVYNSRPLSFVKLESAGIPLHPHNFVLQILLELGWLGIAYAFIILCFFLNTIFKKTSNNLYISATCISFFSFMMIASISYGIWQSWWLCAISLTAAISQIFLRDCVADSVGLDKVKG